jgi:hypothetical protein
MVLAIEPMVNVGSEEVVVDEADQWTARTKDGSLSAHFEHSVAILEEGPWVMSRPGSGNWVAARREQQGSSAAALRAQPMGNWA